MLYLHYWPKLSYWLCPVVLLQRGMSFLIKTNCLLVTAQTLHPIAVCVATLRKPVSYPTSRVTQSFIFDCIILLKATCHQAHTVWTAGYGACSCSAGLIVSIFSCELWVRSWNLLHWGGGNNASPDSAAEDHRADLSGQSSHLEPGQEHPVWWMTFYNSVYSFKESIQIYS